jgi:cell division protein FtsN
LLAGLVLGAALSALTILRDWRSQVPDAPRPAATEPNAERPLADAAPNSAPARPRYDFFTILPANEERVSDEQVRAEAKRPEIAAPPGTRLYLQYGSFSNARDAEQLKATIALLGIATQVSTATIDGATWHRVRSGPYASAAELEQVRQQAQQGGVAALVVRERTSP